MRRRSGMLSGLLLAAAALTAQAQDKLPAEKQPDVVSGAAVDDIIRQTVIQASDYAGPSGPAYRFEGGAELLFLRPYWDGFSNGFLSVGTSFGDFAVSTQQSPEYDMEPGCRLWLAVAGEGAFGGRIRYFHFDADTDLTLVSQGSFTEVETGATSMEMHVLDLEGTFQRVGSRWAILAAAGLRYAKLERSITESQATDFGGQSSIFFVDHLEVDYEGIGPTFALDGRRRVGGSGFSFFVNGRASVLFGEAHYNRYFLDDFFGNVFEFFEQASTDNSFLVLECQIGLEYAREFRLGEGFARIALESQYWLDAGQIVGFSEPHDDLTLLGLSLAAGIRR